MPSSTPDPVVDLALELASDLPKRDVAEMAAALRAGRETVLGLRQRAGGLALRHAINRLLATAEDLHYASGALLAAAVAVERAREQQLVDVVWTGPASAVTTARLTPAVVAELLGEARTEVLIIGYAVQETAGITSALQAAAERGVAITLLLERQEDNPHFDQKSAPLGGVPARRLSWPASSRGLHASLHAKVLVVDRSAALIGSANLTGAAMERNLECGLLLRGGPHPGRIMEHVDSLYAQGHLLRLKG